MLQAHKLFCTASVLAIFAHSSCAAEPQIVTCDVGEANRQALVYAPTKPAGASGSPLVFVFHGHGGSPQNIARSMHLQELWPEAIVVYPQGVPTVTKVDPKGEKAGWQRAPGDNGDRDLKFFDALLASLHKQFTVDDKHVYAAGFSNGGLFTNLLWGERANVIAAFAPCAGPPSQGVKLTIAKPVFIVAGEADPIVPIAMQRAAVEQARTLNNATAEGKKISDGAVHYASKSGTPVQTLIHPGGHVLPPDTPKLIVEFFKAH